MKRFWSLRRVTEGWVAGERLGEKAGGRVRAGGGVK